MSVVLYIDIASYFSTLEIQSGMLVFKGKRSITHHSTIYIVSLIGGRKEGGLSFPQNKVAQKIIGAELK